ncbi:hypothetical protein [Nonomuraea sp. NPDC052265]|uniref:hypothetical protein n=1 Tax=Nonomuraea sp. NPDC052265 TaxID=3364374 RepID=UPI0037C89EEF
MPPTPNRAGFWADAGPAWRAAAEPGPSVTETEAAAEAVRSGRPVEVLGPRGEAREVYAQPDGAGLQLPRQSMSTPGLMRRGWRRG